MPTSARRRAPGAVLATVLTSSLLFTACTGDDDPETSATDETVGRSAQPPEPDLASGLLLADAFGPDAAVVAASPEQLSQVIGVVQDGHRLLQLMALSVEPGAVQDPAAFADLLAQAYQVQAAALG